LTEPTIDAWIERGIMQTAFLNHENDESTLGLPATAKSVITVGAVAAGTPIRLADFSSYGPTRDGRRKPDVAAPGIDISVARGGTPDQALTMSGTSIAAAHVTGIVAMVLSQTAGGDSGPPTADQIASALRQTTVNFDSQWDRGQGFGVVDPAKFLAAFQGAPRVQT
jgi:subtilisin family serine protease